MQTTSLLTSSAAISALLMLLLPAGIYAPVPPCSPLAFINTAVESEQLAWLLEGLPGHPVAPCPYESKHNAPLEEKSIIAFFGSDPQRIVDELRAEGFFWSELGFSRLNRRFWELYDAWTVEQALIRDGHELPPAIIDADAPYYFPDENNAYHIDGHPSSGGVTTVVVKDEPAEIITHNSLPASSVTTYDESGNEVFRQRRFVPNIFGGSGSSGGGFGGFELPYLPQLPNPFNFFSALDAGGVYENDGYASSDYLGQGLFDDYDSSPAYETRPAFDEFGSESAFNPGVEYAVRPQYDAYGVSADYGEPLY